MLLNKMYRSSKISWFVILCRYIGKAIYVLSSIIKNIDDYKVTYMWYKDLCKDWVQLFLSTLAKHYQKKKS